MEGNIKRLVVLRPMVEELMAIAETARLAYGISYRGEIIHSETFGYCNVEGTLPVNEDTIFQAASLTKLLLAAEIGMLVEEKEFCWDTPLKEILPEMHVEDR
ncbi:hypothetical protein MMC25_003852 [Agyrium rufum]|nr:hypothetical protein [Agyrium rufum]